MATDFQKLHKRTNDCVAQTRCDKRTLATLTQYFMKHRGYVTSMSELVRLALEMVESYVEAQHTDLVVLSSADADDLLNRQFKVNLHPEGKYKRSFIQKLQKEDAFLEGRDVETVGMTRLTKAMVDVHQRQSSEITPEMVMEAAEKIREEKPVKKRVFRKPDNIVTDDGPAPEDIRRHEEQTAKEKDALGTVPQDTVAEEDTDNDANN